MASFPFGWGRSCLRLRGSFVVCFAFLFSCDTWRFDHACSQKVAVSATDCKGDFTVSSQQDADTQLASCDTIIGSIIIGGNYSGPLVIPNITNSTEDIMVQSIYEPTGLLLGPQSLTSLQADNVVTMAEGDLCLVDVPVLTYVSMAKLQNADSINIAFNSSGTLNLPALANASDIHVFGSITR